MAVRAPPDRPVVQAIALADRKVVDAGNAASHRAALVKLPILVAERPKPVKTSEITTDQTAAAL